VTDPLQPTEPRHHRFGDGVVVGVDVGTTAAKVVAFGLGHRTRIVVAYEYPLLRPVPDAAVQDPQVILAAVDGALAEVVRRSRGAPVELISVSTAMHALVGVNAHAHPVTPVITWADGRAGAAEGTALGAAGLGLYALGAAASPAAGVQRLAAPEPTEGPDVVVADPCDVATCRAVRAGVGGLLDSFAGRRTCCRARGASRRRQPLGNSWQLVVAVVGWALHWGQPHS
jgi:sugar (pentulose or hexulose) kinase